MYARICFEMMIRTCNNDSVRYNFRKASSTSPQQLSDHIFITQSCHDVLNQKIVSRFVREMNRQRHLMSFSRNLHNSSGDQNSQVLA